MDEKPSWKFPRINRGQAIFLWIVGVIALLAGYNSSLEYGDPTIAYIVSVVAILLALSYRSADKK